MTAQRSDFFALIIGINKYKEQDDLFPELFGSVADAESFKQYFQDDLGVPEDNITFLSNTVATRDRILQGFRDLATDTRIPQGSGICIYFAGHGATVDALPGWEAGGTQGKIQAFVPYDCSEDPNSPILPIMDHEVSALINSICEAKGNNITIIFDCCHSASGTRNTPDVGELGRVRCARRDLSFPIHASMHNTSVKSDRSSTNIIPAGQIGLQSHVLLAACKSTEWAYENLNLRGAFSIALLSLLKKARIDKLRYSDILQNLDRLPRQNPQCEGVHQDRYIFSSTSSGKALTLRVTKSGAIALEGGISNGVTRGSEFNVFSHISPDIILGQFVVDTANLYKSTGTMTFNEEAGTLIPDQHWYLAKQTKSGEHTALNIYTQDPSFAEQLRAHLQTTKPRFSNFEIAQLESEAHIAIEKRDGDMARLRVIDPSLDPTRKTFEGYLCDMKNLGAVFEGISVYHWTRDNGGKNVALRQSVIDNVEVEFYKLKYHGRRANVKFSRDSDNLYIFQDGHKQVNLAIDDNSEGFYGIKLTNNSDYDLFPAVFYFDSDDLSICLYYKSPQTGPHQKPEAPLAASGGTFTIGYGSGGAHPFSFSVPEGQKYDVGLVKIFLFTRPVDVSDLCQESPFDMIARTDGKPPSDKRRVWGVIDVPVMQRRENPDHGGEDQKAT